LIAKLGIQFLAGPALVAGKMYDWLGARWTSGTLGRFMEDFDREWDGHHWCYLRRKR